MNYRTFIGVFGLLATATVAADKALPNLEGVAFVTPPRPVADFTLTDQDGHPFRFSSLRGHPVLVFFGFAHCPDICPAALASLRQLERTAPREMDGARVLFVSVDGERDGPAELKRYLAGFSPRFIGLTDKPAKVSEIAARFPAVFFKGIPPAPGGDYAVQHTSQIYVVDAQGRIHAQFTNASVDSMKAALGRLRPANP